MTDRVPGFRRKIAAGLDFLLCATLTLFGWATIAAVFLVPPTACESDPARVRELGLTFGLTFLAAAIRIGVKA